MYLSGYSFPSKLIPLHFEQLKQLKVLDLDEKWEIVVDKVDILIVRDQNITENWLKSMVESNNLAKSIFLDGPWENDKIANKFVEKVKASTELQLLMCDKLPVNQIRDLVTHLKQLKTFFNRGCEENQVEMEKALQLINIADGTKWTLKFHCYDFGFEFEGSSFYSYFKFVKTNGKLNLR